MYENGESVAPDYALAMKWYQKAAAGGISQSENNIWIYVPGRRGRARGLWLGARRQQSVYGPYGSMPTGLGSGFRGFRGS